MKLKTDPKPSSQNSQDIANTPSLKPFLSKGQIFNAICIVISLLADIVGLGLFIYGLLNAHIDLPNRPQLTSLFFGASAFIYVYSFFYLFYLACLKVVSAKTEHGRIKWSVFDKLTGYVSTIFVIIPFPVPMLVSSP